MANNVDAVFALAQKGDKQGSFDLCYRSMREDPKNLGYVEALAFCFMRIEQWAVAYHLLHYVREKAGQAPEILNNLAMNASSLASATGDDSYLDEAEQLSRKAWRRIENIDHRKDARAKKAKCGVLSNLALYVLNKGDPVNSERFARQALEIDPEAWPCRETLGYALLHQGQWAEGFENYEYALGDKYRTPNPIGGEPYWRGEKGGTLYLRGEQGIGDELTYWGCLADAAKDNKLIVECDHRLEGLLKRSFPDLEIHGTRFEKEREWAKGRSADSHALCGSLCRTYRKTSESIPRTAFLVPDPERSLQWRALLDTLPGKKIGIAWTGGLPNTFNKRRSFSLSALLPILKIPGITWVSLQYLDPSEEIRSLKELHGVDIRHWARAVDKGVDYDETAALVSELDAVVTVTTAAAHLCGALGKKAYLLVPKRCRWFYAGSGPEHRWYESLECFRQDEKWPVEKLAAKLKADLWK